MLSGLSVRASDKQSASNAYINVESNNIPTLTMNWNKQLGIVGVSSMYPGATNWFAFDLSPAATVGTAITIPTTEFTVDGKAYKFDQEYTFYFDGTVWTAEFVAVPEEPGEPEDQTVILGELVIGEWCASTSSATQLRVDVLSHNLPAKIENWNSQLGIAGVSSMYNGGDGKWFAMDLSPAATVGTAIVIPTTEFVVDGVTYKFDKEYTFYFNGTTWTTEFVAVPEEPENPEVDQTLMTLGEIQGNSIANTIFVSATNVPVIVKNWVWEWPESVAFRSSITLTGTTATITGGLSIYSESEGILVITGLNAVAGTYIKIDGGVTLTIDGNERKFDKAYEFWFNGETWQTEEFSVTVINQVLMGEWCTSTSKANQIRVNAVSLNIPTTVVNWIWTGEGGSLSEFGRAMTSSASSIYGQGADWFVIDLHAPASEGTQIVLAGNKTFTVDGVNYMFDKDYTFTYSNGVWTVA